MKAPGPPRPVTRTLLVVLLLLVAGAIVNPAYAGDRLWDTSAPDALGPVFLFNLVLAVVMLLVFLRTRKIKFRTAGIGLGLQAFGIALYLAAGWQILPMCVALAGTCVILVSGVIRRSF